MTTDPTVSVISIFYNAEAFFEEAIESVIAQSCDDWELLLVDDGSTDRSTAIAKAYVDRYPAKIRYLEHPDHQNRGMSATRNLGIATARGEFIAFIDADDVWLPSKLAEQVAVMEGNPALGAVAGDILYWHSWAGGPDKLVKTGAEHDRPLKPPRASIALYPLGKKPAPCPSDILLRTELVRRLGGFEEHFTGPRQMYEDQGFFAKLYLAAPIQFCSRSWIKYRQHDNSIVADVLKTGRYHEVRRYFLDWFSGYLDRSGQGSPRVRLALWRARLVYTAPQLSRRLDYVESLPGRVRRRLIRMVKPTQTNAQRR